MTARKHFILSIFSGATILAFGPQLMAMLPPDWPGGPCVLPGEAQSSFILSPGEVMEVAAGTSKGEKAFVAVYGEGVEISISGDIKKLKCQPEEPLTTACTFKGTGRPELEGEERKYGTAYITLSGVTEPTEVVLLTQIP